VTNQQINELELDRLWNDLTAGRPPSAAYDLSVEAADTVRLFQVLTSTPPPDAVRERVGHRVMATIDRSEKEQIMSNTVPWAGTRTIATAPGGQRTVKQTNNLREERLKGFGIRATGRLASAALLLITLFGVFQVALHSLPTQSGRNGAVLPFQSGRNGAVVPAAATKCESTNSDAIADTSSPVPVNLPKASPAASRTDTVSFVWATDGAPEAPKLTSHIVIDPQCRLWVIDHFANRFLIFDLDGKLLETWGGPGAAAGQFNFGNEDYYFLNGIAFAPDGDFYVSDGANLRVQQFDSDRVFVREWRLSGDDEAASNIPSSIVVGPDGNVYVSVYTVHGIIQVFTPDGVFIRKFGSGAAGPAQISSPAPIAFDQTGNLWVIDTPRRTLVKFSVTGELLERIEIPEMGPQSRNLAIDADNRIYIVDIDDHTVSVFDSAGTFLYAWGEFGLGEGEFLNPFGIALDGSGGIYISEGGSPRVQKFQIQSQ